MTRTIWKPINGFEGYYEVSNKGHIRSLCRTVVQKDLTVRVSRGRIISPSVNNRGYLRVNLYKPELNGTYKSLLVHRIVALAFLPTENPDWDVNHKSGDKRDCSVDNLEWLSHEDNVNHAFETRLATRIAVEAICPKTGQVARYKSLAAAARVHSARKNPSTIKKALAFGGLAHGFEWRVVQ